MDGRERWGLTSVVLLFLTYAVAAHDAGTCLWDAATDMLLMTTTTTATPNEREVQHERAEQGTIPEHKRQKLTPEAITSALRNMAVDRSPLPSNQPRPLSPSAMMKR